MNRKPNFEAILIDTSRFVAEIAAEAVGSNPELFREIYELAVNGNRLMAMRASRVVGLCALRHPQLVKPYIADIIDVLPHHPNHSLRRNFAKILTAHELPTEPVLIVKLLNICFDWIYSPHEKVAVKVYSLDILTKIAMQEPEISNEINLAIEDQLDKTSVAFRTYSKKVMRKLSRLP